jgi:hypothetical protein
VCSPDYDFTRVNSVFDSLSQGAQAISALAGINPQCIRLHTADHLEEQAPCPHANQHNNRTDPFVDGLEHNFGEKTRTSACTAAFASGASMSIAAATTFNTSKAMRGL